MFLQNLQCFFRGGLFGVLAVLRASGRQQFLPEEDGDFVAGFMRGAGHGQYFVVRRLVQRRLRVFLKCALRVQAVRRRSGSFTFSSRRFRMKCSAVSYPASM